MRIAVASGKGGTGKTTVATNLAFVAAWRDHSVAYLDCDVEEPNGAIFLKPQLGEGHPVTTTVPKVDAAKCNGCGLCGRICQYSAIVPMGRTVLLFPELCHGCGGCRLVCPTGAIREGEREVGWLRAGSAGKVEFVEGLLNVGEAMSRPVVRAVKSSAPAVDLTVVDCPPGMSCPVIESMRGVDYVLLVTEPTPFGLHDLKLMVETVRKLEILFGVVINRTGIGNGEVLRYCRHERITVTAELADDRRVAEAYSRGELASETIADYRRLYARLLDRIPSGGTSG